MLKAVTLHDVRPAARKPCSAGRPLGGCRTFMQGRGLVCMHGSWSPVLHAAVMLRCLGDVCPCVWRPMHADTMQLPCTDTRPPCNIQHCLCVKSAYKLEALCCTECLIGCYVAAGHCCINNDPEHVAASPTLLLYCEPGVIAS